MITGKTNQKFQQKTYHANVNVNLIEENIIRVKSGIMINVNAKCKKHYLCEKKLYFESYYM